MLKADFQRYLLKFKSPVVTSRGVYTERASWFLSVWDEASPDIRGIGECAPLPGLSSELDADFEKHLEDLCRNVNQSHTWLQDNRRGYSSIRMGLETSLSDLRSGGRRVLHITDFTRGVQGIPINGLIWMGPIDFMKHQIDEKLRAGFRCLKLKIGAMDFEKEWALIRKIRQDFPCEEVEIRLDANGAFNFSEAKEVLSALGEMGIHSMEQPISAGQWTHMASLCRTSPIPLALDEELIGIDDPDEKATLIREIRPAWLVLKPSLHGGFSGCLEWIDLARKAGVGWWVTSALESNIGLNAIAQWASTLNNPLHQGLGTGQLFTNNFPSPLYIDGDQLRWRPGASFDLSGLHHD